MASRTPAGRQTNVILRFSLRSVGRSVGRSTISRHCLTDLPTYLRQAGLIVANCTSVEIELSFRMIFHPSIHWPDEVALFAPYKAAERKNERSVKLTWTD